jgi:hypothetical protein
MVVMKLPGVSVHMVVESYFPTLCKEVFALPSSWREPYSDTAKTWRHEARLNDALAAVLFSMSDFTMDDIRAAMPSSGLNDIKANPAPTIRGSWRYDIEEVFTAEIATFVRRALAVRDEVTTKFPHDSRLVAFVLAMAYSLDELLVLSPSELERALFLAASKPGAFDWETVQSILSSGVDDALLSSFLEVA